MASVFDFFCEVGHASSAALAGRSTFVGRAVGRTFDWNFVRRGKESEKEAESDGKKRPRRMGQMAKGTDPQQRHRPKVDDRPRRTGELSPVPSRLDTRPPQPSPMRPISDVKPPVEAWARERKFNQRDRTYSSVGAGKWATKAVGFRSKLRSQSEQFFMGMNIMTITPGPL